MIEDLLGLLVTIPILLFTLCLVLVVWSVEVCLIIIGYLLANPHILLFLIILYLLLK
jgi:hypothetical protein